MKPVVTLAQNTKRPIDLGEGWQGKWRRHHFSIKKEANSGNQTTKKGAFADTLNKKVDGAYFRRKTWVK